MIHSFFLWSLCSWLLLGQISWEKKELEKGFLNQEITIDELTQAPQLTFSTNIPITMSDENKKNLTDPKQVEKNAHLNKETVEEKTIPWLEMTILFLGIISYWISQQPFLKKMKAEEKASADAEKPKSKALDDLALIFQKNVEKQQLFDQFYVELSDLIRHYLAEHYGMNALHQTTPEFLKAAAHNKLLSKQSRSLLQQFLQLSDQVKFAQYHPSSEECKEGKKIAENLIKLNDSL